jgi:hypothetical protein
MSSQLEDLQKSMESSQVGLSVGTMALERAICPLLFVTMHRYPEQQLNPRSV